jgi:hypothetical protein
MTDYEIIVLAVRHNIHGETTDPQAIAFAREIRRSALEEAAAAIYPHNRSADWTEYAKIRAEAADAIRALSQKESGE